MSVVRSAFAVVGRVVGAFTPEPGTTEGAVMLGIALLAVGFVIGGYVPLAFIVPGALLVAIGVHPLIRRS